MFLLDTNVVSELRFGKKHQSEAVREWAATKDATQLYVSAVTMYELEMGVLMMERRDPLQARVLRDWVDFVHRSFSGLILPFGTATAVHCAPLQVPNRRPERDAMIAATAKEHGFTVVTRNTRDFEDCGVQLLNPWL